ncbi:MAG TPA: transketolase [Terriglobus sp.]
MEVNSQTPLDVVARELRADTVEMVYRSRASHLGSCLSMADILACLYWKVLKIDPQNPTWEERDHFILSKGHGAAILYAALAERGFYPKSDLELYCKNGSKLTGHATSGVPGVELSTGSLGHGLPVGCGIALAKKQSRKSSRVFVLLSDGELDEGSNWEAFLFAPHHKLSNLVAIIDYNKIQSFGRTADVLNLEPLADKMRAFGWAVREVDGHDFDELEAAFGSVPDAEGRPTVVIAHTVKGKGIHFMEDRLEWHYKSPTEEQVVDALKELGVSR